MAGGVFSGAKLNAMTIRESANDGSDFTNPDADYRRLFLGEDGLLHVKDSAGAVTGPYGAAGSILAYKAHTAGDETIATATMTDVDATNAAVTFTAPASGNILVRLSAVVAPQQTAAAYVSWGLRESTSDIAGAAGDSIACRAAAAATAEYIGASMAFVLTGISAGSHTYKMSWASSTGTALMKANANAPLVMEVLALP